jgi:hypothetical protein
MNMRLAAAALALVLTAGILPGIAVAADMPEDDRVDTALVVAVDVSLSVDDGRYALQKDGVAAAFESKGVADAIAAGRNHAIEVLMLEFSDPDRQTIVIPWTRVNSADEAQALAQRIRAVRRSSHGLTDLAEALLAARAELATAPYPAERRVVDISSDGMSNIGSSMSAARDTLTADGITVNGLPILSEEPWLATYYTEYVIGGEGSFIQVAQSPESFAVAMQKKLARELMISAVE